MATDPSPAIVRPYELSDNLVTPRQSYIDWSSILAGTAVAVAMSLVLIAFGTSIGLTVSSPWSSSGASAETVGIAAAIWFALVHIWSLGTGAYLTGRLRTNSHDSTLQEAHFRDGANGLTVWAAAIVISALLAASVLSSAATTAGQTASSVTATAANALTPVAERAIDSAFEAATAPADDETATPGQTQRPIQQALPQLSEQERSRLMRILTTAITDEEFEAQDRRYLERLVAQKTGVAPEQAKAQVAKSYDAAVATAKELTETAKQATAFAGFWSAIVFLLSGVAAWWSASLGGSHRDEVVQPARRDPIV